MADVDRVISFLLGFYNSTFADDLNVWKHFELGISNDTILHELEIVQTQIHLWGSSNRVEFDNQKEHFVILHPIFGLASLFKLLGCIIDAKLTMRDCVHDLVNRTKYKVTAILRTRPFYSVNDLIIQYKSYILSILESFNACIFHASTTLLAKLDCVQNRFILELGLTQESAALRHNLLPLHTRRNIGMLGFLHKSARRIVFYTIRNPPTRSARSPRLHNLQLFNGHWTSHCPQLFSQSLFGLIRIYNILSPDFVEKQSVQELQHHLTDFVKNRILDGYVNWNNTFNPRTTHFCYRIGN